MATAAEEIEERVLVLAPIGRDAQAAAQQLGESSIACVICAGVHDLHQKLKEGAAVALVAEEAFLRESSRELDLWLARQPPWSDFPFVVLTSHHTSAVAHAHRLRLLDSLGNVSLLERPLGAVTLVSAVQAALRARRKQYEVRRHLLEREHTAAQLEDQVRERTRQLQDANQQLRLEMAERKQAEAALHQALKMEVIGQMTGGVAHDFNNLLTAVLGNLELASRRNQDEALRRFLDGATQAAQRGAKLTSQLLAFSRTQRLQTEPSDLNTLVTSMGDLLFRTIGATVRIETILQKDLWPAMIDPSQIELVILNLALNARDAMPGGGRVTISTANAAQADGQPTSDLPPGDYVVVSVSDTGSGMTDDVLARAFEPFFTTKGVGSGTGLGLSQVYGIAKQSGGGVRIDTTLNRGTTVSVYLPRAQSAPSRQTVDRVSPSSSHSRAAAILVADDDRDVRELTVACLESLGYRVLAADGGRSALELIENAASVDLLLVDMAMPEMNGAEVARAVTAKRPDLPVLYMTGYIGPIQLDAAEQQRLLKKPFTITELAEKVKEVLDTRTIETDTSNVFSIRPGSRG